MADFTTSKVEIEHLQGEIDLRQAKIDVNADLQRQVAELQKQLQISEQARKD